MQPLSNNSLKRHYASSETKDYVGEVAYGWRGSGLRGPGDARADRSGIVSVSGAPGSGFGIQDMAFRTCGF